MTQNLVRCLLSQPDLHGAPAVLLFGGPCVMLDGSRVEVPDGSKRLLVFITLNSGRVDRRFAAGSLWPDGSDERASGNLRSALWRLRCAGIDLVDSDRQGLMLRSGTIVDIRLVWEWAGRLADGTATQADLRVVNWPNVALDLLPGWYDDWVIFERERIRQRLLHGLEMLSRRLAAADRSGEAVEAAILAVSADPLRESASRALIEAHLAEGNLIEARRAFERYRDIVHRELGTEPGAELSRLVRGGHRQREMSEANRRNPTLAVPSAR